MPTGLTRTIQEIAIHIGNPIDHDANSLRHAVCEHADSGFISNDERNRLLQRIDNAEFPTDSTVTANE